MSDPLASQPFAWRRAGAGVEITYGGRPVRMLRGPDASELIDLLMKASPPEAQQALARSGTPPTRPRGR
jgi:hypothetical protein